MSDFTRAERLRDANQKGVMERRECDRDNMTKKRWARASMWGIWNKIKTEKDFDSCTFFAGRREAASLEQSGYMTRIILPSAESGMQAARRAEVATEAAAVE